MSAPASLALEPGGSHALSLWVTNLGHTGWGQKAVPGTKSVGNRKPVGSSPATHARIVGTWVALGVDDPAQVDAAAAASITPAELPAAFAPRAVTKTDLLLFAPSTAGEYLLVTTS